MPPPMDPLIVVTAAFEASFHLPPATPYVEPQLNPSQPHLDSFIYY